VLLDFDEGERLLEALRASAHERLGFGSFVEYVGRLFGYAPRLTHDKLRVAEALEALPELGKALREGQASWSCVRELSRVATRETEHAWLEAARGRSVREVERRVSGHQRGSLPSDPSSPQAERHVLRSRFRARFSPFFARPWPRFGAPRAARSMTTRRYC
jgi:hypothetical protein